jgi:hypothetical protein
VNRLKVSFVDDGNFCDGSDRGSDSDFDGSDNANGSRDNASDIGGNDDGSDSIGNDDDGSD